MNEVIEKAIELSRLYADHIFKPAIDLDHSMRKCPSIKEVSNELDWLANVLLG